jgi:hypothetical protein
VLQRTFQCLKLISKASCVRKALKGRIEVSDGRDAQNMWHRLEMFHRISYISTFNFAWFEVSKVLLAFMNVFVDIGQQFLILNSINPIPLMMYVVTQMET